jgi:hypothetical protein
MWANASPDVRQARHHRDPEPGRLPADVVRNRLAQLAKDPDAFWAELEQGERDGWLCSGVVCFTAAGRKPSP